MKKRTSNILKWLGGIAIVLTLIYGITMISANRALSRATEALKADGRPITSKEVTPTRVPDRDNAALVYESVILRLKAQKAGETNLWAALGKAAEKVLKESPDPEAMDQFGQVYDRPVVAKLLSEVDEGSRKPGYWNDIDYGRGIELELPHISDLMDLSRVLCAGVRLQSEAGDPAGAWDSALTGLRVADALKDEPILISQLVRATQFKVAMRVMQELPYSALSYPEVDRLLKACEDPAPLVAAFDGERIHFGDFVFRSVSQARRLELLGMIESLVGSGDGSGALSATLYSLFPQFTKWDHATYRATFHAYGKRLLEPYSPTDPEAHESVPGYCLITRALISALGNIKGTFISLSAQARVTRSGLAILKHREEQNAWPEALPIAKDLLDPFTGKPLIYQSSANGFVIYSVGKNLVDDQGKKEKNNKGDIAWWYSITPEN